MKKFEAQTLEETYELAKKHFDCSISQLEYEIIQYPSKGFLGFGKRLAIIIAGYVSSESEINDELVVESVKENIFEPIEETIELSTYNDINHNMYDDNKETHTIQNSQLAKTIEDEIKRLFELSCYNVDVVEVDVVDNNALIFIDGDDVALLIGKDGYRYNAISYMLFNWLYTKYELFVKLEIASFITSQEEMVANMLLTVIDKINSDGKGRTRPFKGILVQIALNQLRDAFPTKYVAIKKNKNGDRYVIVNDFNSRPNE